MYFHLRLFELQANNERCLKCYQKYKDDILFIISINVIQLPGTYWQAISFLVQYYIEYFFHAYQRLPYDIPKTFNGLGKLK